MIRFSVLYRQLFPATPKFYPVRKKSKSALKNFVIYRFEKWPLSSRSCIIFCIQIPIGSNLVTFQSFVNEHYKSTVLPPRLFEDFISYVPHLRMLLRVRVFSGDSFQLMIEYRHFDNLFSGFWSIRRNHLFAWVSITGTFQTLLDIWVNMVWLSVSINQLSVSFCRSHRRKLVNLKKEQIFCYPEGFEALAMLESLKLWQFSGEFIQQYTCTNNAFCVRVRWFLYIELLQRLFLAIFNFHVVFGSVSQRFRERMKVSAGGDRSRSKFEYHLFKFFKQLFVPVHRIPKITPQKAVLVHGYRPVPVNTVDLLRILCKVVHLLKLLC